MARESQASGDAAVPSGRRKRPPRKVIAVAHVVAAVLNSPMRADPFVRGGRGIWSDAVADPEDDLGRLRAKPSRRGLRRLPTVRSMPTHGLDQLFPEASSAKPASVVTADTVRVRGSSQSAVRPAVSALADPHGLATRQRPVQAGRRELGRCIRSDPGRQLILPEAIAATRAKDLRRVRDAAREHTTLPGRGPRCSPVRGRNRVRSSPPTIQTADRRFDRPAAGADIQVRRLAIRRKARYPLSRL